MPASILSLTVQPNNAPFTVMTEIRGHFDMCVCVRVCVFTASKCAGEIGEIEEVA